MVGREPDSDRGRGIVKQSRTRESLRMRQLPQPLHGGFGLDPRQLHQKIAQRACVRDRDRIIQGRPLLKQNPGAIAFTEVEPLLGDRREFPAKL